MQAWLLPIHWRARASQSRSTTWGLAAQVRPCTPICLCIFTRLQESPGCSHLDRRACPASHIQHAERSGGKRDSPCPATGGRASSREVSLGAFDYLQFDHGCQFITASTRIALEQILDWERRGKPSLSLAIVGMPAVPEMRRPTVCAAPRLSASQHGRQGASFCWLIQQGLACCLSS